MPVLILYSRKGCCLCEGLEEKLGDLLPPGALQVVDVDGDPALQARYGLAVPVLACSATVNQEYGEITRMVELPPVPARLQGEGLRKWLDRHMSLGTP